MVFTHSKSSGVRFDHSMYGWLALVFSLLCVGAVLCFRFPTVFTTPELRAVYPIPFLRSVLAFFLLLSFLLGLISFFLSHNKVVSLTAIAFSSLAVALGGSWVEVPDHVTTHYYVGLDWFVLDLLILGLIFVPLEYVLKRLREQKITRPAWKTDLAHFFFSHLFVQATSLLILMPSVTLSEYLVHPKVQSLVQSQPVVLQFLEIVIIADFCQYWIHWAFHKIPFLWRFHAIHHSAESMDWLAGSRLHVVDVVVTRGLTLIPLYCLGFEQSVLQAYLLFVAFLATFIHANIDLSLKPLHKVIATPQFHHWHHADDVQAIDKNFAVHLPLFDILFGTYYVPSQWPSAYGISGAKVPEGYWKHLVFPFLISKKS